MEPERRHIQENQENRNEGRDEGGPRREAIAYQGAFEAVASIMIGGGLGYYADSRFDSSPFGLLAGFAIGFGAFFVRLTRLRRSLDALAKPGESDSDR